MASGMAELVDAGSIQVAHCEVVNVVRSIASGLEVMTHVKHPRMHVGSIPTSTTKNIWSGHGYNLAEFAEDHHKRWLRKEQEDKVLNRKNRRYYDVFIYDFD
jgi:hypothetical protein